MQSQGVIVGGVNDRADGIYEENGIPIFPDLLDRPEISSKIPSYE
jgi:hypothetical protein